MMHYCWMCVARAQIREDNALELEILVWDARLFLKPTFKQGSTRECRVTEGQTGRKLEPRRFQRDSAAEDGANEEGVRGEDASGWLQMAPSKTCFWRRVAKPLPSQVRRRALHCISAWLALTSLIPFPARPDPLQTDASVEIRLLHHTGPCVKTSRRILRLRPIDVKYSVAAAATCAHARRLMKCHAHAAVHSSGSRSAWVSNDLSCSKLN